MREFHLSRLIYALFSSFDWIFFLRKFKRNDGKRILLFPLFSHKFHRKVLPPFCSAFFARFFCFAFFFQQKRSKSKKTFEYALKIAIKTSNKHLKLVEASSAFYTATRTAFSGEVIFVLRLLSLAKSNWISLPSFFWFDNKDDDDEICLRQIPDRLKMCHEKHHVQTLRFFYARTHTHTHSSRIQPKNGPLFDTHLTKGNWLNYQNAKCFY